MKSSFLIFLKKLYLYLEILNLFKKGQSLDSNKVQYNTTNECCTDLVWLQAPWCVAVTLYRVWLQSRLQEFENIVNNGNRVIDT
jgi:hypothetical protein